MFADNISVVITFLSEGDTRSSEEAAGERETLSISCRNQAADGEGEERVAVRRAREEVESVPPPQKRTRQEGDSGYESLRQLPTPHTALPLPSPRATHLTNPHTHTHSSSRNIPIYLR